jgi:hypothetical protein
LAATSPGEGFADISCNGLGLVEHELPIHECGNTSERMQIQIFDAHLRCKRVDLHILISEALFG